MGLKALILLFTLQAFAAQNQLAPRQLSSARPGATGDHALGSQRLGTSSILRQTTLLSPEVFPANIGQTGMSLSVHPQLIGQVSQTDSAISVELGNQASALESLQENSQHGETRADFDASAVEFLAEQFQSHSPIARIGAGVAVRLLAGEQPRGDTTLAESAQRIQAAPLKSFNEGDSSVIDKLLELARNDETVQAVFDGNTGDASVEFPDETVDRDKALGSGNFGVVQPHPEITGAVVKWITVNASASDELRQRTPFAEQDAFITDKLYQDGLGPRVVGNATTKRNPGTVKEQVYGETINELVQAGRFGREEHQMVLDLLEHMAGSGRVYSDLRLDNLMIGRTLLDSRRRAYLVDATAPEKASPILTKYWILQGILNDPTLEGQETAVFGGQTIRWRPLRHLLDLALVESGHADAEMQRRVLRKESFYSFRPILYRIGIAAIAVIFLISTWLS